jgi:putative oxidoreductase
MSAGLLIVRLVLGLGFAAHGAQKLFGWFGGHGLAGTGGFFEGLGFRPGKRFALLAGLGEMSGGLLVALGLFGPAGPAIVVMVMIVAAVTVHVGNGFFASSSGIEMPLLYAAGVTAIAFAGPGAWSLDAALGLESLWTPANAWLGLGIAVLLAAGNLAMRRSPQEAPAGRGEPIEAS